MTHEDLVFPLDSSQKLSPRGGTSKTMVWSLLNESLHPFPLVHQIMEQLHILSVKAFLHFFGEEKIVLP